MFVSRDRGGGGNNSLNSTLSSGSTNVRTSSVTTDNTDLLSTQSFDTFTIVNNESSHTNTSPNLLSPNRYRHLVIVSQPVPTFGDSLPTGTDIW